MKKSQKAFKYFLIVFNDDKYGVRYELFCICRHVRVRF